jgi:hypothetical protein
MRKLRSATLPVAASRSAAAGWLLSLLHLLRLSLVSLVHLLSSRFISLLFRQLLISFVN